MKKKSKKIKTTVLTAIKPIYYPSELIFGSVTCGIEPLHSDVYYNRYYENKDVKKEE